MVRATRAIAALIAASVVAAGVLHAAGGTSGGDGTSLGPPAWKSASFRHDVPLGGRAGASTALTSAPRIRPREAALDRRRWRAIVIHDSGTPAGDVHSLERRHRQAGLAGLGFHFVVGNGQGMGDGEVSAGPRWERQLAGAHAARGWATPGVPGGAVALDSAALNQSAVAICLVGRADRRRFTERQCREVRALVQELQSELAIPSEAVFLSRELQGGHPEPSASWAALRAFIAP